MKSPKYETLAKIDGATNLSLAEESKRQKIRFTKPEQFMFGVATRLCHNQKDVVKGLVIEIGECKETGKKAYRVSADILLPRPHKTDIPFTDERSAASALMNLELSAAQRNWENPIFQQTIFDQPKPSKRQKS